MTGCSLTLQEKLSSILSKFALAIPSLGELSPRQCTLFTALVLVANNLGRRLTVSKLEKDVVRFWCFQ